MPAQMPFPAQVPCFASRGVRLLGLLASLLTRGFAISDRFHPMPVAPVQTEIRSERSSRWPRSPLKLYAMVLGLAIAAYLALKQLKQKVAPITP